MRVYLVLTLIVLAAILMAAHARRSRPDPMAPRILAVYPDGRAILDTGETTGPGAVDWRTFRGEP